jgi:UDP-galactopyranose mutase
MDIICFCHLRWNFVYQRPQHLLSRFAYQDRVFVIEEPLFDANSSYAETSLSKENVWVITPHLPKELTPGEIISEQTTLIKKLFSDLEIDDYIAWFYTPMALDIYQTLPEAKLVIYDCMDELSAFKNAPQGISMKESLLLQKADLVFTGGYSLYEAKQHQHPAVFPFPSSIDKAHFSKARHDQTIPHDQLNIPCPRIGFFGVIDERFDIDLLGNAAALKPGWQFVIIGPTVKIDPASLPNASNIHYLGSKSYEELPTYLAGWDVAMIPFARNESTRYISPTKTPEYLAGGVPVVSTSIQDVVKPYGQEKLVYIADEPEEFINGVEWCLSNRSNSQWLKAVDDFLANISWDVTWLQMMLLIQGKLKTKQSRNLITKENEYV